MYRLASNIFTVLGFHFISGFLYGLEEFLSVATAAAAKSLQSCPTLCDPMDCSLPGSSVHGIFQARILKWVAISISRGSSQPRDQTQVYFLPSIKEELVKAVLMLCALVSASIST